MYVYKEMHFLALNSIPCSTNQSSDVYYDLDCRPSHEKTVQDPPLLYDLHLDPSELYTLTPDDPVYNQTMSIILKVLYC